jgi:primosomal protein N' (replication factor Y)
MSEMLQILKIAVPAPLRRLFDYRLPSSWDGALPKPGSRVRVPFGRNVLVGILVSTEFAQCDRTLKPIEEFLDSEPVLDSSLLQLLLWSASYYCHPLGDVIASALPAKLRQGKAAKRQLSEFWQAMPHRDAPDALSRAPKQRALYQYLELSGAPRSPDELNRAFMRWRPAMLQLESRGLVQRVKRATTSAPVKTRKSVFELTHAQKIAVDTVIACTNQYKSFLLHGVTGSGKTEVYLQLAQHILQQNMQVLVLVPEIGLTPQLAHSFRERFDVEVALLHSGLNDTERLDGWVAAKQGDAGIIIGTRSAVFVPVASPGLIIVDEEHDSSFKQMDGFRYSARDVAMKRAADLNIPIVLGSATPSLESFRNVERNKMTLLSLPERVGDATHPDIHLVDLRGKKLEHGMMPLVLEEIQNELGNGGQVLMFLNRRGYAPALVCRSCGWVSHCESCDVRMTLHKGAGKLRCHVCSRETRLPARCPACGQDDLFHLGYGTERIEEFLERRFASFGVLRIDRDTTRSKHAFETMIRQVRSGEKRILIGTQMLAKGHHFPQVGLVVIIDADSGLYGLDFRAQERMAQLLTQVAGRAGRANRPGRVYIQSYHPDHPFFEKLSRQPYEDFASELLKERDATAMPPSSYLALLRAEAGELTDVERFLEHANAEAASLIEASFQQAPLQRLGPAIAPLERRAGRYQMQLILKSGSRGLMQKLLHQWVEKIEGLKLARRVRWSIDVDPYDLY